MISAILLAAATAHGLPSFTFAGVVPGRSFLGASVPADCSDRRFCVLRNGKEGKFHYRVASFLLDEHGVVCSLRVEFATNDIRKAIESARARYGTPKRSTTTSAAWVFAEGTFAVTVEFGRPIATFSGPCLVPLPT
jgi:hypothetical protein